MNTLMKLSFAVLCLCFYISALEVSNGYYTWYKKPCKRNDPNFSDCLLRTVRRGTPELRHGDPKRHLPNIDPFFLPQMEIRTGSDQVGLNLNMKNVSIYGLPDIQYVAIKANLTERKVEYVINTKTINLDGDYVAGGKIIILPVVGDGKFKFSLKDMKCRLKIKYDLVKKADGKEYMNFTQVQFLIDDIKHARYSLENLFHGDKLLGGQILTFINSSWREVFEEVRPGIQSTMSAVIQFLISPAAKVPYDYIFPPS